MRPADDAAARAVRLFAAAMAGEIAHELNNRLATMRETVGLLEDLARADKAGAAGTTRAHASLDDQVGRALNIVRTLGRLGGALGADARSFDVGAAVGDLLAMTERWSRRLSLRVESRIAAGLPPAAGDPALFLCLTRRLLERCAATLQPGGTVLVRVDAADARVVVRLVPTGPRGNDPAASAAADEELDRELALRLGGGLVLEGGGALTIVLAATR